jgi:SNF2 family DNA or RNA helicase
MELYAHQKRILEENKPKALLGLGTGTGKTLLALELAEGRTLVICPKQQKLDKTWEENALKFGIIINLTVISKEDIRRDWNILEQYDTVIVDECHYCLGVEPYTRQRNKIEIPKTSQIYEALFKYLKKYPPQRLYLCSATPATKAMKIWALARIYGRNWNFYKFRDFFYIKRKKGRINFWIEKDTKEIKDKKIELIKSFGYTGRLQDFVDVPEQTHQNVYFELTDEQKQKVKQIKEKQQLDVNVLRTKMRTIENGVLYNHKIEKITEREERLVKSFETFHSHKIDYIKERTEEYDKIVVFANYTAQIFAIEKELKKEGLNVLTLTGQTKDKDRINIIKEADKAEKCIIVIQANISAGYQLPSFPCVIYASKSYKYEDYEQSLGRVLRGDHLKKNLYIHLILKGGVDEQCHKSIMEGKDFQEKLMSQELSTV